MIYPSDIPSDVTELAKRRQKLAMMTDIPDMWKYADAWNELGADFQAVGYKTNAEKCYQKSMHYAAQAGPRERKLLSYCLLYCATCETWTEHALNVTHDFYSCGCGDGSQVERSGLASAMEVLK